MRSNRVLVGLTALLLAGGAVASSHALAALGAPAAQETPEREFMLFMADKPG